MSLTAFYWAGKATPVLPASVYAMVEQVRQQFGSWRSTDLDRECPKCLSGEAGASVWSMLHSEITAAGLRATEL